MIKSLFLILTLFKKNNKPHNFTPPLPSGRGGVKIWGLLFFPDILHPWFVMKIWFITILWVFASRSLHEVVKLGPEIIELWFIRTKYLNWMMRRTHHVCDSYLIIRLTQLYTLSVTPVKFYAGGRYKLLNQCKSN